MAPSAKDKRDTALRHALLWLLETAGPWLLRAYFATIRLRENNNSRRRRAERRGVYAFWHAHQLAAVSAYQNLGVHILASRSKDGELIARLARGMGCHPVRGSSSRGGAEAGRELVRIARRGEPVVLTPDGPRGPRHEVQLGTLFVARLAKVPVFPVAIGLSKCWEVNSWDRFRIPKPFSRAVALVGEPVEVPKGGGEAALAEAAEHLRDALNRLEEEADRLAKEWAGGRFGDDG